MGNRIRATRSTIRKHMNVFVDGERAGLETPLAPGAEVYVRTAISGGEALVVRIRRLVPGRVLTEADAISVVRRVAANACNSSLARFSTKRQS